MKNIKSYDNFLNEGLMDKVSGFLKNLFKVTPKDNAEVSTKKTEKSKPIEDVKPIEIKQRDPISVWAEEFSRGQQEVNDELQKMADDISLDFAKNQRSNKIISVNEYPNMAIYYSFDDGRKVKFSYVPGGKGGFITWQRKDRITTTFDINSFTVNNWINEFTKLKHFAI